ncbi:unnamed protein product [Cochlearia groenlandica]
MSVSFNTTIHKPCLNPSCNGIKLYAGLKPQSQSFVAHGYQNLNKDFYQRIHKSLQSGTGRASRSRVKMMPIGTPRVPYRNREEGTWQWVDIWNALGQRFAMPLSRIALQSPAGSARGQADDIQNEAKELSRIRDYLFNELAKNTGQPAEKIFKDLSRVKKVQRRRSYGVWTYR